MIKRKKAQSAMEFLTTYGWILLILLATIGVLMKYGFLEPGKYLPEKIEFGDQLVAEEYFFDDDVDGDGGPATDQLIAIKFRNNFPRDITILGYPDLTKVITASTNVDNYNLCWNDQVTISSGESQIIACWIPGIGLTKNRKNKLNFQVQFKRVGGTRTHTITGIVYAEPVSGEYCSLTDEDGTLIYEIDNNLLTVASMCTP